jgi:hypothetical protein
METTNAFKFLMHRQSSAKAETTTSPKSYTLSWLIKIANLQLLGFRLERQSAS